MQDEQCAAAAQTGLEADAPFADAFSCCRCICGKCGPPALVAFSGKRQWSELINTGRKGKNKVAKFDIGPQSMRPEVGLSYSFVQKMLMFSKSPMCILEECLLVDIQRQALCRVGKEMYIGLSLWHTKH